MSAHPGFTAIPNVVLRNRKLTVTAKVVYGIILSYAWGDNLCTKDWSEICEDCAIGRSAFFEAVAALCREGLLAVDKRAVRRGYQNVYRPLLRGATAEPVPADRVRNPDEVPDEVPDAVEATSPTRARVTRKTKEDKDALLFDSEDPPRPRRATRNGRNVPTALSERAVSLFEFACAELGSRRRPLTATGEPSPDLKTIIGRVVEYPDVTEAELKGKIKAYIKNPPSWIEGRPTIGQIFGPRAFGHLLDYEAERPPKRNRLTEILSGIGDGSYKGEGS